MMWVMSSQSVSLTKDLHLYPYPLWLIPSFLQFLQSRELLITYCYTVHSRHSRTEVRVKPQKIKIGKTKLSKLRGNLGLAIPLL